ncbi:porin family protein [Hymenobacter sp. ASUV-10]|uniref:Porin family protein n=1 Tax=Hymenobacter aranciens TaxID=3063996 RepID=A0ABT9BGJ9_9BACT|nr:porin family protein [Hymenobacter sp. ASUV-10]MDO7876819.1 porin family protein [Hymenobacter sp. ASUV-10]
MKHSLLLLALLAGSTGAAGAQTLAAASPTAPAADSTRRPGLLLGLTLGPMASRFMGADATTGQKAQYRPGVHAGLMADVHLSDTWTFHPEVLYAEKGSSYDRDMQIPDLRLRYIDVPLLARRYFDGVTGKQAWFLEAGPRVSALLAARQSDTEADLKSSFRTLDAGFLLGIGYRNADGIAIGLRYDVGITNAYKTVAPEASGGRGSYQPNHRNDAYFLSVSFPLLGGK